jgi:hypothetical protein
MVSKETYYKRKEAGLCTKCGKSRDGSPSQARCLDCHNKLKQKTQTPEVSTQEVIESIKSTSQPLDITRDKECRGCGNSTNFHILYCQKCLNQLTFSKEQAISRYEGVCYSCQEQSLDKLKVVSSNIGKALDYKDQELYKRICYRKTPPIEYKVLCHHCYWQEAVNYTKQLRIIFEQTGSTDTILQDDDVIDLS